MCLQEKVFFEQVKEQQIQKDDKQLEQAKEQQLQKDECYVCIYIHTHTHTHTQRYIYIYILPKVHKRLYDLPGRLVSLEQCETNS